MTNQFNANRELLLAQNAVLRQKLKDVVVGLDVLEKNLARAIKADFGDAPIDLDGKEASIHHRAQASAYQHALEMCNSQSLSQFVKNGFSEDSDKITVRLTLQTADDCLGSESFDASGSLGPMVWDSSPDEHTESADISIYRGKEVLQELTILGHQWRDIDMHGELNALVAQAIEELSLKCFDEFKPEAQTTNQTQGA